MTPQYFRTFSRGKRINAIAGISMDGLVAVETVSSTVNAEVFFDFARRSLIPNMLPYDGQAHKSILIMAVHHTQEIFLHK